MIKCVYGSMSVCLFNVTAHIHTVRCMFLIADRSCFQLSPRVAVPPCPSATHRSVCSIYALVFSRVHQDVDELNSPVRLYIFTNVCILQLYNQDGICVLLLNWAVWIHLYAWVREYECKIWQRETEHFYQRELLLALPLDLFFPSNCRVPAISHSDATQWYQALLALNTRL